MPAPDAITRSTRGDRCESEADALRSIPCRAQINWFLAQLVDRTASFTWALMEERGVDQLIRSSFSGRLYMTTRNYPVELAAVDRLIAEQNARVDLNYLEQRAERKRPNDFFYGRSNYPIAGSLMIE